MVSTAGSSLAGFLWYEYWVARNNHYFLTKNAHALRGRGPGGALYSKPYATFCVEGWGTLDDFDLSFGGGSRPKTREWGGKLGI